MKNTDLICPCGSELMLSKCCGPLLSGGQSALTAEQLMRSRYTAYVMEDSAYLKKTWHPAHMPAVIDFDRATRWLGLKVVSSQDGGPNDEQGTVEFVARYKLHGKGHRLHEVSQFIRLSNDWVYVEAADGTA